MKFRLPSLKTGCLLLGLVFAAGLVGLYLSAAVFPAVGAQGAEILRRTIGDEATARLESFIFTLQDAFKQTKYGLGIEKPAAPWQISQQNVTPTPSALPATITPTPEIPPTLTPTPEFTLTPLPPGPTPLPAAWTPPPAKSLGRLDGEGIWQPYLSDGQGNLVAYRTFIQPDPRRPYTLVGVVAFDLNRTRMNFIPGTEEPVAASSSIPRRSGKIPQADLRPGVLLAAFNGGFKANHGNFGAHGEGITIIPPTDGLATVAMYRDGSIKIGEWGKDIVLTEKMAAWRQNCHLVVRNAEINPLVNVNSVEYWGANLDGATVTWRSGIGLNPEGNILYYFAGSSMMADVLAKTMLAVGVKNGMQLDINNYWVHFTAIHSESGTLQVDALFPEEMKSGIDRYLTQHNRDFFYIAIKQ